jgi:micrococcal nuclease
LTFLNTEYTLIISRLRKKIDEEERVLEKMKKFSQMNNRYKQYIGLFYYFLFSVCFLYAQDIYRVNSNNVRLSTNVNIRYLTRAFVTKVIDGDTIQVRIDTPPTLLYIVEWIRLLGIDTPETVDRRKEIEYFGKEAALFTKKSIEKSTVFLAFDWDLRDQYERLLAYVYLENGICFNAELIKRGYAYVYTRYPFQFLNEFKNYEHTARNNKAGLWY